MDILEPSAIAVQQEIQRRIRLQSEATPRCEVTIAYPVHEGSPSGPPIASAEPIYDLDDNCSVDSYPWAVLRAEYPYAWSSVEAQVPFAGFCLQS